MTDFNRLHPALQHHIVNSLGWRQLRPFQEVAIAPVIDGKHALVLAPTAGGKTEAAFFPVLSRMLADGWSKLSVLYICPIKALLNNLEPRLDRYCGLVGRRSAVWHGDVGASARKRLLADPPDCLLTTPESLESMLVSSKVDAQSFLAGIRAVVIDEVHAFAGDDRGWHLLSVLDRLEQLAARPIQRIGLSATVGNPDELLEWLCAKSTSPRFCSDPPAPSSVEPDVQIDYVGSLENASTVIARLHRGEKRLVFVDSRARAEKLGHMLQSANVQCFVTHSSLSASQRHDAERAFVSRSNCVIVATSALELGIDIGDLDRVIQIDAPVTVSSFLQRMGRSGRREGTVRNCLFLTTHDLALLQSISLMELWAAGFVEPVKAPPLPYHIIAQQLMALALQNGGVERATWPHHIVDLIKTSGIEDAAADQIVRWMIEQDILWEEAGILWFGKEGDAQYSRRHYTELLSVFTSPPLIRVLHGRHEVGLLDQLSLMSRQDGPRVILLGGRAWRVTEVDWSRRSAQVVPSDQSGRSRWLGEAQGLSAAVAQQIRHLLLEDTNRDLLSKRAQAQLADLKSHGLYVVDPSATVLVNSRSSWQWWTFGGARANATLASMLGASLGVRTTSDSLTVTIDADVDIEVLHRTLRSVLQSPPASMFPLPDEQALEGLKFAECLPAELAIRLFQVRMSDPLGVATVASLPFRFEAKTH